MIRTSTGVPELFLTQGTAGIGGRLKDRPEDFFVEEIPAYEPCGNGEHIYLWIEKINRPTLEVVREVARAFKVRVGDVGFAGMKDKTAVTRQLLSVHAVKLGIERADRIAQDLSIRGVEVMRIDRHTNKLRMGHLRGNRFIIRIRGVEATSARAALTIVSALEQAAVPNFVGEQRFGFHQNNHVIGRLIVLQRWQAACDALLGPTEAGDDAAHEARVLYAHGELDKALEAWPARTGTELEVLRGLSEGRDAPRVIMRLTQTARMYFISAFQSAVFNEILARRIRDGGFDRFEIGDIAVREDGRAPFWIGDGELADESVRDRLARLEIGPSGPMWGAQMLRAREGVGQVEEEALHETGVKVEDFDTPPIEVHGTRRPMRLPLTEPDVEGGCDEHGSYVQLRFTLPRGGFATTVLREVMKPTGREHPWGSDSGGE